MDWPQYGFGFGIRDSLDEDQKVLIIKTAWGGKTLAGDFRPPSSVASSGPIAQSGPSKHQHGTTHSTPTQTDPFCTGDCPNQVGDAIQVYGCMSE